MITRYGILAKVIETGSFSKTAEELGYSQPAVSQAVKGIESELHTVLIQRNREGLTLTKDGESYLPYIRAIVTAEENLDRKRDEMDGLEEQTIRIGTFTSVSRNLLPPLMASFHQKHPSVQFELRQGEYDNIHEWLLSGLIDFGFTRAGIYPDLHTEVICRDTMVAVLPPHHRLCRRKTVSLQDLAEEPFILLDEGKNSIPLKAFAEYGLSPRIAYKVYDDYSIMAMVKQNMGVSMLYRMVTAGFEKDAEVREIREPVGRLIAMVCRNPETTGIAAKAFMEYIREEVPGVLGKLGIKV
jgi:DNA-binding transcriptional LysR family regulator